MTTRVRDFLDFAVGVALGVLATFALLHLSTEILATLLVVSTALQMHPANWRSR